MLVLTSTATSDTGSYLISLTVSDLQPLSVATSFTITITNSPPALVGTIPSQTVIHGNNLSIALSSYFNDANGDPMTMTATSSYNGAAALAIPNGII
jgi:hypothetical protein